jgi:hypothetical protein
MIEVLPRRLLERVYLAALRINARHDVLDHAILAGRVHRLKDKQQRPAILGIQHVLFPCEPFRRALEHLGRIALAHL